MLTKLDNGLASGLFQVGQGTTKQLMPDSRYAGSSVFIVVLYTRRRCHLCDDALRVLVRHGLTPTCIDIDEDPLLREKFDRCVPVVEIGGRVRFRGGVHPLLLRRIIRNELAAK